MNNNQQQGSRQIAPIRRVVFAMAMTVVESFSVVVVATFMVSIFFAVELFSCFDNLSHQKRASSRHFVFVSCPQRILLSSLLPQWRWNDDLTTMQ